MSRTQPPPPPASNETDRPVSADTYSARRVLSFANVPALFGIAAILACTVVAFAYTGGFLSPHRLTQTRVVDQFERANGPHPGFRRNHSKGVCFTGSFESDGQGERLSKALIFKPGTTPVFGRFALAGGQPFMMDGPTAVRSMAVNFTLSNGEIWRTGMNGIPVFTVHSLRDLYDQLGAATPDPRTGKPDPARMKAFFASHPDTARAMKIIMAQPFSSGFADTTYNSLDAFIFTSSQGQTTPVRWSMVPEEPFRPDKPTPAQLQDHNYLFDDLADRVHAAPVRWRLIATIGRPEDPTSDPTQAWPADREHVQLGVLTVNQLQDETQGPCRDVTFDPLILPAGIEGSDDPILSARSAAYSPSFVRRSGEPAPSPAVRFSASGAEGAHQ
ncbi:catalase family peroxidase [Paraburkholderia sp. DHOC27]|uniref:catalase family peroxidase n=1 Tax=Paraburkholderia sp. DHOC27 TaxID=2303330 RepID=UPI00216B0B66|nr:catalase family peroxidase [Paraburkholderia sp. DHOC27]